MYTNVREKVGEKKRGGEWEKSDFPDSDRVELILLVRQTRERA